MYCRHNNIDLSHETLLFIHGLGESGLCFIEALQHPFLHNYNILVPDLIGFGRSSAAKANDYSFISQVNRLSTLLDATNIKRVHIIGHSMGGDLGTQFCEWQPSRIASFVNIEGDLTPDDRFISTEAIKAERDGRFEQWLRDDFELDQVSNKWAADWPSCVRYIASLRMCRPSAFLASVHQTYELNESILGSELGTIGQQYQRLPVPKVFCWGTESLSARSKAFLANSELEHYGFPHTFHWLMLDAPDTFYSFLAGFLGQNRNVT